MPYCDKKKPAISGGICSSHDRQVDAGKTTAIRGNRVVVLRSLAANHAEGGTGAGPGLSWGKLTRLQGTPRRGKVTPESSLSPWRGPTFRDLPTHSDRSGSMDQRI